MGLAVGECLLSHPIALWVRWIVDDWQLWHLISETILLGRDLDHWRHHCSKIVWRGHKHVCQGASVQGGSLPLLRQQYIMQCLHGSTLGVSEAGRACRSKEWPHCFLLLSILSRWAQDRAAEAALVLWLCLGGGACPAVLEGPDAQPVCMVLVGWSTCTTSSRIWEKSSTGGCKLLRS